MSLIPSHPDFLFVSCRPLWPLEHGVSICGCQMARALTRQNVRVAIASIEPLPEDAPPELRRINVPWPRASASDIAQLRRGWGGALRAVRHRLARYDGIDPLALSGVVGLTRALSPRVVIGVGLHSPLMLRALRDNGSRPLKRIWYGADELVYHHVTCLGREPWGRWPRRLWQLVRHAMHERLFVPGLDGAIGVSPLDAFLLRWIAGAKEGLTIRNGVDLEYFTPPPRSARANWRQRFSTAGTSENDAPRRSAVFWGCMDFYPNADAARWFAHRVWPLVRARWPEARFQIVGKRPGPGIVDLGRIPGIHVLGEVPDVRPFAWHSTVTVQPMQCGTGIKNKLLEAAAMGRPIIASPHAVRGLRFDGPRRPMLVCASPDQWVEALQRLWENQDLAGQLGREARSWARQHHSWGAAAQTLRERVLPPCHPPMAGTPAPHQEGLRRAA